MSMDMGMDKSLRPMQTLTMNCTECGQPLSKPAEMAGEREIDENIALNADPEYVEKNVPSDNAICSKCGRPYRKDSLNSDFKGTLNMIVDLYLVENGKCRVIGTVTFENGRLSATGYGLQLINQPLLHCRDWEDMEGGFDVEPQAEPERFMEELPTMFRGNLRAIVREEGRAEPASLEAHQLPRDDYDGLTGCDLMAKRPSYYADVRRLMAQFDAEDAEEDAGP